MALADYNAYLNALQNNYAENFQSNNSTGRSARLNAWWRGALPQPATPTTSVATNKNSDVSIGVLPNISAGRLTPLGSRINAGGASGGASVAGAGCVLIDLLNHSGGLSGIVTTAQTTNLPTATLTRYTSGEGVMAAIIIYTAVGLTTTTATVSYTNQSGTSGQVSTAIQFGGATAGAALAFIPIPLAAGDTGVRSVESVTLAATTGTAGNFGVCLFKPLQMLALNDTSSSMSLDSVSSGGVIGSLCEIDPNACLTLLSIANVTQIVNGAIILAEV